MSHKSLLPYSASLPWEVFESLHCGSSCRRIGNHFHDYQAYDESVQGKSKAFGKLKQYNE